MRTWSLFSRSVHLNPVKLLTLQGDTDQQSKPKQLAKPLTSQRSTAVGRPVEMVKMKMVEDENEEKFAKKEKKLKNGQVSLPKNKNCTVDDDSPAEVKKEKKKSKKVDVVAIDIEECSWSGGGEKEEKKKKKKKRTVTESLDEANGSDVKNENNEARKKKKKKQLTDDENPVETVQSSLKEEVENKQGKEKRLKYKSVHVKSENIRIEKGEEQEQQAAHDKPPKKAKKGKNNALVISTEEAEEQVKERKKKRKKTTDDETTDATDAVSVTKNKNKDKTKVAEHQVKSETAEGEMGEVVEVKQEKRVKKEKRKEKREEEGREDVGTPIRKKDKSTESEIHSVEEGQTELKKKRKKEKGRKAPVEVSEVEETEPKKKRKKQTSEEEKEEPQSLKCQKVEVQRRETVDIVAGDTTRKKRKKIPMNIETQEENVSVESGAEKKKKKKKKIKEEVEDQHESPQVDVVFLSEKAGNTDEVNISQERRQALQMEIDHASQPQKPAQLKGFGQWSTAEFNSSEQQQKFLRLMGGFKKGFQAAAGNTEKANMALGKDSQQHLQQGLLGEFERAHSRRLDFSNRGAGLGFTAPSNKKFAIDVNACRSVRFDD